MKPKDFRRPCPDKLCFTKNGTNTDIIPVICITTGFGEKEFEYPRFICLPCATEFIDTKLLHTLIDAYTDSVSIRKKMTAEIRNGIKKSARACKRSVKIIYRLKKKENPT